MANPPALKASVALLTAGVDADSAWPIWSRASLAGWVAFLLLALPVWAQEVDRLPVFTGQVVDVAGVEDTYASVRDTIRKVEADSQQTYYVVIRPTFGQGEWGARDFVDELARRWVAKSSSAGRTFDPQRSVIVALAINDRRLAVHPGTLLQEEYLLKGQRIDRELVQPRFVPHARGGDYASGISALIDGIEDWVSQRDTLRRRSEEEAQQQQAALARNADAMLARTSSLAAEVSRELTAQRERGFSLAELTARRQSLETQAAELAEARTRDPAAVLQQGPILLQGLETLLRESRELLAVRIRTAGQLERVRQQAAELDESLTQSRRSGLAVEPVQLQLDQVYAQLDQAAAALEAAPQQAAMQMTQADSHLQSARKLHRQLPQLRDQIEAERRLANDGARQFESSVRDAEQQGVDVSEPQGQLDAARESLQTAQLREGTDYQQTLAAYAAASKQLEAGRRSLVSSIQQHQWQTRTLPLLVGAALFAVLVVAVGIVRWLHIHHRRQVLDRWESFKGQVMDLSARVDALKKRHARLPVADPDFTHPMTGATQALYESVQSLIDRMWDRWLAKMTVWDRAEELIQTERPWSWSNFAAARQVLDVELDFADVEQAYTQSADGLDQVEQAHEHATEAAEELAAAFAARDGQTLSLESHQLATTPYLAELQAARAHAAEAETLHQADPIGARDLRRQGASILTIVGQRMEAVLLQAAACDAVQVAIDELAQQTTRLRDQQNLRLSESGSNPDEFLAAAQAAHQQARDALGRGDSAEAEHALQTAQGQLDQTRQAIARQQQARETCARQLPKIERELSRLVTLRETTLPLHAQLEAEFAADSWAEVAEHPTQAQVLIDETAAQFDAAVRDADPQRQHYEQAAGRIEGIVQAHLEVNRLLVDVAGFLAELRATREAAQDQICELQTDVQSVGAFFDAQADIVGDDVRGQLAAAETTLSGIMRQAKEAAPHWPVLTRQLDALAGQLVTARQQADDDVRCHRELRARLGGVSREVARVESLLAAHTADRPQANQRFRAARDAFRQTTAQSESRRADWTALLAGLAQIESGLGKAEQLAADDIRLAATAAAEISDAEHELRRARGFYRLGILADASVAERKLSDAREWLQRQEYEVAIDLAGEAQRSAAAAYDEAESQARHKERELDRERRRREQASIAAAAATAASVAALNRQASSSTSVSGIASLGSNHAPAASPAAGTSSSHAGSGGSSTSSWSSGSSQSSW